MAHRSIRPTSTARPLMAMAGTTVVLTVLLAAGCHPRSVLATDSGAGGSGGVSGGDITAEVNYEAPPSSQRDVSSEVQNCTWTTVRRTHRRTGVWGPVHKMRNGLRYTLFLRTCNGPPRTVVQTWLADTSLTGGRHVVASRRKIPHPLFNVSPATDRVVVKVPTWFWVPRSMWRPISVSATIPTPSGPVVVTTTATPTRLIFTPGDGSSDVSCGGPGTAPSRGSRDSEATSCSFIYRHSSISRHGGAFHATVTIRWKVRWRTNFGTSGRLPDVHTSASSEVVVREIQAIAS